MAGLRRRSARPRSISCSCDSTEASRFPRSVSKIGGSGRFPRRSGITSIARAGEPPSEGNRRSAAACDGWTLTREISWPCSFSSAAEDQPVRGRRDPPPARGAARAGRWRAPVSRCRPPPRGAGARAFARARRWSAPASPAPAAIPRAARLRPAASPSRNPAACASRAFCSSCRSKLRDRARRRPAGGGSLAAFRPRRH